MKFKCVDVGCSDFNFIVGKFYDFFECDYLNCLATYDDDGFPYYMVGCEVEWEEIEDDNQCKN